MKYSYINLGLLLLFTSCGGNGNGTNESSLFPVFKKSRELQTEAVNFNQLKSEVLEPKGCLNCHDSDGYGYEEGLLSAKNATGSLLIKQGDYKNSIFFNWLDTGKMPKKKSKLSEDQLALVKNYIENVNKTTQPKVDPPIQKIEPKFSSIRTLIFETKCIKCHGTNGEVAKIPLIDYNLLLNSPREIVLPNNANESGLILVTESTGADLMPPLSSGFQRLTAEEIDAIKNWINSGALNN